MKHNKCGNEYLVRPDHFISNGRRCPYCSKRTKKSTEEFKEEIYNLTNGEYELISEYINRETKVKIRHIKCGNEFEIKPLQFLKGGRCPKCNNHMRTTEQFKKEICDLVGDEYELLGDYKGYLENINIKHNKCGHEYITNPYRFLSRGQRCPYCSNKKEDINSFKEKVFNLVGDEYEVLGNYIDSKTPIKIRHNKCGYIFYKKPVNFLMEQGCLKCSGLLKKDTEQFKKEVKELVGDEYSVLGEYINNKTKILIRHNTCGNEYYVKPNNFLNNNNRCKKCCNNVSNSENELKEFIKEIYNGKIIFNNKSIIKPLELDIYLPDIKLAIEFDGLYWHSNKFLDKNYHYEKYKRCLDLDIKLIHIFEDNWNNHKERIKNYLDRIINSKDNMVYSLDNYNIKKNTKKYSLYVNDNLVFYIKIKDNHIIKYYNSINSCLPFELLLKEYIKDTNYNEYYFRMDLRYVYNLNDDILNNLGFEYYKYIKPKYSYIKNDSKQNKIRTKEVTSLKIYNCGYKLYKLDRKEGN